MELYPSLKPLPKPERPKVKEVTIKGQVRQAVYEREALKKAFKTSK